MVRSPRSPMVPARRNRPARARGNPGDRRRGSAVLSPLRSVVHRAGRARGGTRAHGQDLPGSHRPSGRSRAGYRGGVRIDPGREGPWPRCAACGEPGGRQWRGSADRQWRGSADWYCQARGLDTDRASLRSPARSGQLTGRRHFRRAGDLIPDVADECGEGHPGYRATPGLAASSAGTIFAPGLKAPCLGRRERGKPPGRSKAAAGPLACR